MECIPHQLWLYLFIVFINMFKNHVTNLQPSLLCPKVTLHEEYNSDDSGFSEIVIQIAIEILV